MATSVMVRLSGRVQGVGFRYFTQKKASELDLNGYVKNLPDGRVEIYMEGEEEGIEQLIETCKNGPRLATVNDIEIQKSIEEKRNHNGFIIKR